MCSGDCMCVLSVTQHLWPRLAWPGYVSHALLLPPLLTPPPFVPAPLQGLWPNYLKVVPSIAIAFVTYEQVKELLGVELRISD
jgi:hypothetical protein